MNEPSPTLVILAAGLGSRFGGLKQLEPVGPGGDALMDYTLFDAVRCGFSRAVFVVRPEMERAFGARAAARYGRRIAVECVSQRLDALPDGHVPPPHRTRPWGTGHAVLAAGDAVRGPFAVANADDYYDRGALEMLAAFLRSPEAAIREAPSAGAPPATFALVGFALRDTLSTGQVNRALVRTVAGDWLARIAEVKGIRRQGADAWYADSHGWRQMISGDACVSMNLWGFTPAIFDELRVAMTSFLASPGAAHDGEFYLPDAVQRAVRAGRARVRVLRCEGVWCGITHPDDRLRVRAVLRDLTERGIYPARLWE